MVPTGMSDIRPTCIFVFSPIYPVSFYRFLLYSFFWGPFFSSSHHGATIKAIQSRRRIFLDRFGCNSIGGRRRSLPHISTLSTPLRKGGFWNIQLVFLSGRASIDSPSLFCLDLAFLLGQKIAAGPGGSLHTCP